MMAHGRAKGKKEQNEAGRKELFQQEMTLSTGKELYRFF